MLTDRLATRSAVSEGLIRNTWLSTVVGVVKEEGGQFTYVGDADVCCRMLPYAAVLYTDVC